MAIARPACSTSTRMSSALLVWRSVALSTGYRLRSRKAAESAKPTATKTKLRIEIGDQLMRDTGIQMMLL